MLVLLALSVLGFGGLSANALPDDKPADRTTDSAKPDKGRDPRLEALWKDLASAEESKATRALLLLTISHKAHAAERDAVTPGIARLGSAGDDSVPT